MGRLGLEGDWFLVFWPMGEATITSSSPVPWQSKMWGEFMVYDLKKWQSIGSPHPIMHTDLQSLNTSLDLRQWTSLFLLLLCEVAFWIKALFQVAHNITAHPADWTLSYFLYSAVIQRWIAQTQSCFKKCHSQQLLLAQKWCSLIFFTCF